MWSPALKILQGLVPKPWTQRPETRLPLKLTELLCHLCQKPPWSSPTGFLTPSVQFSSVAQSCPTLCDPMDCSTPGICSNSCPLSWWCHTTISSSVVPFSSCPQSLPASGTFQTSQLFASSGQSIGVSASTSVLPMNTQDWSPLGWTGWISLQSKGLSRVFANTTVQKH